MTLQRCFQANLEKGHKAVREIPEAGYVGKMTINFDVFGLFMEDIIMIDINCTPIVIVN